MKKLLLFFVIISLFGCSAIRNETKETVIIDCPRVFFSSENSVYIDGENDKTELDKINYKASLNNYGFVGDCLVDLDFNSFDLELLVVAEPINPKNENIDIPVFVLLYNLENKIIDKQFFRVKGKLKYNYETSIYEITEIIGKINIFVDVKKETNSIIIGFVKLN